MVATNIILYNIISVRAKPLAVKNNWTKLFAGKLWWRGMKIRQISAAGGVVGHICANGDLASEYCFPDVSPDNGTLLWQVNIFGMVFLHGVCISLSRFCSTRSSFIYVHHGVCGVCALVNPKGVGKSLFLDAIIYMNKVTKWHFWERNNNNNFRYPQRSLLTS